jgi:flagellar hook-basal body complex protein FliE
MRVKELVPDAAPRAVAPSGAGSSSSADAFGALVDAASGVLGRADEAERAFAAHRGGLQEMVVERARADIALQIAAAGAQRVTQGLQTLLGMQI